MIAHASTDPSRHCKTAYVRSPYGDESPAALAAVVADGYNVDVRWTVDSLSWDGLAADQIEVRVLGMATPGGIVLMHVGADSQDANISVTRIVTMPGTTVKRAWHAACYAALRPSFTYRYRRGPCARATHR